MEINTKTAIGTDIKPYTQVHTDNQSFDQTYQTYVHQPLGFDGVSVQRSNADNLAIKVTESGSITYIGRAAPGTDQSTAKWQCFKVDESSGTVITYADGNSSWDNVATDLTALSYS